MRLKTFTADDMQHAMQLVRESLGEDAVIISTKRKGQSGSVEITAAFDDITEEEAVQDDEWFNALNSVAHYITTQPVEQPDIVPKADIIPPQESGENYVIPDSILKEVEELITFHGANEQVKSHVSTVLKQLNERDILPYLSRKPTYAWLSALMQHFATYQPLFPENGVLRHILIGTSGAGKTLTTAKIAALCVQQGWPIHVISTDNKRAGGVEQLEAITDILNLTLHVAEDRQMLKEILNDLPTDEHVIVDSAGANPYDFYELKHLAEFASLMELTPVLVYPAGCDPIEASEVAQAFSFIGVKQMIVTRTDTAKRFGSILNAAHAANLCFSNLTGSEQIVGSFNLADPQALADLFISYSAQRPS